MRQMTARKPPAWTITTAGNKPKKVNWQPTMAAAGRLKSQQIVGNRLQSGKSRQKSSMQSSNQVLSTNLHASQQNEHSGPCSHYFLHSCIQVTKWHQWSSRYLHPLQKEMMIHIWWQWRTSQINASVLASHYISLGNQRYCINPEVQLLAAHKQPGLAWDERPSKMPGSNHTHTYNHNSPPQTTPLH